MRCAGKTEEDIVIQSVTRGFEYLSGSGGDPGVVPRVASGNTRNQAMPRRANPRS